MIWRRKPVAESPLPQLKSGAMLSELVLQPWEAPSGMYHLFSKAFEVDPEESYGATNGFGARFPALDPPAHALANGYITTANLFESDIDAAADAEAVVLARVGTGDSSPMRVTTCGPNAWGVQLVDEQGVPHVLVALAVGSVEVIVEGYGDQADQSSVLSIAERLYQRTQSDRPDPRTEVPASDLEIIEQFEEEYSASLADGAQAFVRFVAAHADPDLQYTCDDCVSSIPDGFAAVAPSISRIELDRIHPDDEWVVPFGAMRDTAPSGRTYVATWWQPPTPSATAVADLASHHVSIRDGMVYMYPDCERGAIQNVKSAMGW